MSSNFLNDNLFSVHANSNKIFIETESQKYSFKEFDYLVNKIANLLIASGLSEGDRVLVKLEKSIFSFALYISTIRAGGIFIPVNTDYTASEIEYFIDNSMPYIFISNDKSIEEVHNKNLKTFSLNNDGSGNFNKNVRTQKTSFQPVKRKKDDIASILYTSGTTGRSKGAMLSHNNLFSNTRELLRIWKFNGNDVLLHALPIYHIHGLFVACNLCLLSGAKIHFIKKFQTETVIEYLPKSTVMMGVPTFYTRLIESNKLNVQITKNIRVFISGSAPLLSETHKEFESLTGHKILERYGMTETNMNTSNPYDGERRAGTVGFPLPGIKIRITDTEKSHKMASEKIGMIEIKGENVFEGYWKMSDKTKESFTDDGYFVTGDLGKFSSDGYLSIIGRNKDLIISGGLNIYPKEIEVVIDGINNVKETAVIGVTHKDFGEAVVAVVVADREKISESSIMEIVQTKLAKFKQPKKIIFVNALPRNAMGKVQKQNLRNNYNKLFN
ncbi:MAG: AMP-binding protein [Candidatus Puniceispirillales bacterium]